MEAIFRKEYHASDPDISVNLKLSESGCFSVLDEASAARMISLLLILPDGMQENFCSRHSKSGLCIHRSDDGGCSYSAGAFEHLFCTKNMESASYGTRRRKIFAIIQWAGSEKTALPIYNDLLILSRFFKFTQNLKQSHQVSCLHKDCHRFIACRLDCAALFRIRILRCA